jgi:hypothetical protein
VHAIRIDPDYVAELEQHCRGIATALAELSFTAERIARAPEVVDALDDFQGRWVKTRTETEEGLTGLADIFRVVHESFREVDQDLATGLHGSRGPGSGGGGR